VLLVLASVAASALAWAMTRPAPGPDVLAVNDLAQRLEESWPDAAGTGAGDPGLSFLVLDTAQREVARGGDAPGSAVEAASRGAQALPVVVGGDQVATLYAVDDGAGRAARAHRGSVATVALCAVALMAGTAAGVLLLVERRVLRPFRRMEAFASRVAAGDLEAPLAMDPGNAFGAFTESFDLMRTEFAASREREDRLTREHRTVIAQLGHDLGTPAASISAAAELLEVDEDDPRRAARLRVIRAKALQIAHLRDDLVSANAQEARELEVRPVEQTSACLLGLLRSSGEQVAAPAPPDCLLVLDARRMQQVLDNIVENAAKYARTPVQAVWRIGPDSLGLRLADGGPGVDEADLAAILGRGVRGRNAEGVPGQGLGLFTAAQLMERMGGSLAVSNLRPGFAVDLEIPLA
jgi:signal transduction histidine kinase